MNYTLGIDVGTTYTGAATAREGRAEIFSLGHDRPTAPTVVVVRESGEILVGDAAERRASTEPNRVAREFKRRVGDPTPVIVGGIPYGVDSLVGHVLRWVYERVVEQEGGPPDRITLTHPASRAGFKQDVLQQAARLGDLPPVELLSEPQAAALRYASEGRVEPGAVVAVYDFGGGTFDAALVRATESGFDLIGEPEGMERLGGLDFDQAVFAHVDQSLDGMLRDLDTSDSAVRAGLLQLRTDCRLAKETLSTDTDTLVPVLVPGVETEVRLTRPEFEAMIRPRVVETVDAMRRTIRSASLEPEQVDAILLVGGSSRIPLVGEVLRSELGRPVVLDNHPKFTIALGAALHSWRAAEQAAAPVAPPVEPPVVAAAPVATAPPVVMPPSASPATGGRPRWLWPAVGVFAAIVIAVVLAFALGGGSDDAATPAATTSPSAPSVPTTAAATTTASTTPPTSAAPATTSAVAPGTTGPVTTEPPATTSPPATTAPATPPGFVSVTSFDGLLTVDVPVEWDDVDTSPFVVVATPTAHISASEDLLAYLDEWTQAGMTIALVDPAEGGSVDELMAAIGPGFGYDVDCGGGTTEPWDNDRVVGLVSDWTDCGGTPTTIRIVVGIVDDNPDWLLLAGIQAPELSDLAVLDQALATVQVG